MGLRSPGRALELCQQQVVFSAKEPSCSLWEQMNSGEQAKMWHHLGIISLLSIALLLRPKLQLYPVLKLVCQTDVQTES